MIPPAPARVTHPATARAAPLPAVAPVAALAGTAGAVLHFAGALKSTPPGAALPFDLTLAALALLAPLLALLLCAAGARHWRVRPGIGPPLAAAAGLWLWLVLAGVWSRSAEILAAKLPEAVLLGPAMLLAGIVLGAEPRARRAFCAATLAIGVFAAAAIAWGLATGRVVLGGLPALTPPDQVRVQYQVAGLAIASAAGLAGVHAAEARLRRRPVAGALWCAALAALAFAALLPGGRAALLGLGLVAALAPALRLWRGGRALGALAWVLLALLLGLGGLGLALADPSRAAGLRTLERLADPDIAESSGRGPLWAEALRRAGEGVPVGLGTGSFPIAAGFGERRGLYPHNHLLEALVEGGLPGVALWLLAFGGAGGAALAGGAAPERLARIAALALPVALAVLVSTDLGNRMAWFALGLALSLGVEAPRPAPAVPPAPGAARPRDADV
ncbi:O-antigen ligase family protein [Caldovatus aquaticus]|uniref:O-antigen ligase domain-containing protein n=1 Tax=Caldovatus aquaticus TaxID=2865671 RepID=A0ABS7F6L2_9PROT|nr:O-antigen ligase family protein [Caldovatus aquaticus]MBW8270445.1 O-antigen ligase domain-containing protein [Caldovatus aquaticus]